jgi:hypothetical protein
MSNIANGDRIRQIATIVGFVLIVVMNFLSQSLPIGGQTNADLVNRIFAGKIYFLPANYVFSIWGVIYTLLLVFTVYQALPAHSADPTLRRIGPWFVMSCLANAGWLALFQTEQWVASMLVMVVLLFALIVIYVRLDAVRSAATTAFRFSVILPFSIYLGWICVATIANATATLYMLGWDGGGVRYENWTAIMLGVAGVLAVVLVLSRRDVALGLVLVWAAVGIAARYPDVPAVAMFAYGAAVVVGGAVLLALITLNRPGTGQPVGRYAAR